MEEGKKIEETFCIIGKRVLHWHIKEAAILEFPNWFDIFSGFCWMITWCERRHVVRESETATEEGEERGELTASVECRLALCEQRNVSGS